MTAAVSALGCQARVAGVDFNWRVHGDGSWDLHGAGLEFTRLPAPALSGAIQYRNAAVAVAALQVVLAPRVPSHAAIAVALRSVQLPGRLQFVPGTIEWVFDVAHNEAAAAVLAGELHARPVRGRTLAVFGVLADKNVRAVAAQLDSLVDHWLLCALPGPRSLTSEELRRRIGTVRGQAEIAGDVAAAVARAEQLAGAGDRILVCGSFHTVGPALQARRLY